METLEQIVSNLMTMIQQNEKFIESPPKPPPPILRISDKSDKSDERSPAIPTKKIPITRSKDWKPTFWSDFYTRRVYGSKQPCQTPKQTPKLDPLRPHEFPPKIVRHRGNPTDKTNFTHLQELWNGREKPLEIKTAGRRTDNLTTKIKP